MVDWLRLVPRLEGGDGRLELEARLRNLDGREMAGEMDLQIQRAATGGTVRLRREFRLPGGTDAAFSMALSVPQPARWSAWRFGEPRLHRAVLSVEVGGALSARVVDDFGFRDLEVAAGREGWRVRLNGRAIFLRGATYAPSVRLDQLTPEDFDRDLRLAREANLDALRVRAHVLPEEFYRRADAAGFVLLADFPLTGAYAYRAAGEDAAFFERAVREQVPEMVEMLRNRPSIASWIVHDDPPWIPSNEDLGDAHSVRLNYSIDQEARALFERLDPTRTALAASGELDTHLHSGWRSSTWADYASVHAGLVTEVGAQAPPTLGSPAWRELGGERWPVSDADPAWIHGGFDPAAWAERGVGPPSEHGDLRQLVESAQQYQAWLLAYAIEQMRKRKFGPCRGVLFHQLVDPFPAVGFGVLDSARVPKEAFTAVTHAMQAVRVILDPLGYVPAAGGRVSFVVGRRAAVRFLVVNDDPTLAGGAAVRWSVWERAEGHTRLVERVRKAMLRRSLSGGEEFRMPSADEPALQVATLDLRDPDAGFYVLEAHLLVEGVTVDVARLAFEMVAAEPRPRPRPRVPAHLAERIVAPDSLRVDESGLALDLLNRARPAVLTAVGGIRLDGRPIDGQRLMIEGTHGRLPLPARLDLPLGRPMRLHVELDRTLDPGHHLLELDLTVPGLAEGWVTVATAQSSD
jgi:hypothetical protein